MNTTFIQSILTRLKQGQAEAARKYGLVSPGAHLVNNNLSDYQLADLSDLKDYQLKVTNPYLYAIMIFSQLSILWRTMKSNLGYEVFSLQGAHAPRFVTSCRCCSIMRFGMSSLIRIRSDSFVKAQSVDLRQWC